MKSPDFEDDLRWGSRDTFEVLPGQSSIFDELEDPEDDGQISLDFPKGPRDV